MKLLDKVWSVLGLTEAEETDQELSHKNEPSVFRPERKDDRTIKQPEDTKQRRNLLPERPQGGIEAPVNPRPFHTPSQGNVAGGKGTLVLTQPKGFDDARLIAENVTAGKAVVVNFERSDSESIKRTVDFMSGITFAVGGNVQRISNSIFLFTPANVEVTSGDSFFDAELPMLRSLNQGRES